MIGIVPSIKTNYEVMGLVGDSDPIEGKLYAKDDRLYFYTTKTKRSNPSTGFFPIWDGKETYITSSSNEKYLDKDIKLIELDKMSKTVDEELANDIKYHLRHAEDEVLLDPSISPEDNMFTQTIKGIITNKKITMTKLVDGCLGILPDDIVKSYYNSLNKITFMRLAKWRIWVDSILHVSYVIIITKGDECILKCKCPDVSNEDPFKKCIRTLIAQGDINKNDMRGTTDDYTINNLFTNLNSDKPISAQLFSRFINLSGLNYEIEFFDNDEMIFNYKE